MDRPTIVSVTPERGRRLHIVWSNGEKTTHDFSGLIAKKAWAAPLADPAVFKQVVVGEGGFDISWPGTEAEAPADALWEDIHPGPPVAEWMSAEQFRGWLDEMDMTWEQAAEALDVSRRTIANYASGAQEVPKAVALACMQLASERLRVLAAKKPKRAAARR